MSNSIPEKDWKQLRKLKPEMLDTLCLRIHMKSEKIIKSSYKSEHEKYLKLYDHIQASDETIARCFNDWRRSNIWMKFYDLLREGLLTDQYIDTLSDETKAHIQLTKQNLKLN